MTVDTDTTERKTVLGKLSGLLNQVLPVILTVATLVMSVQITQGYKLAEDIGSIKERLQILIEKNEEHTSSINDLRLDERRSWERLTDNSGVLGTVASQLEGITSMRLRDVPKMQAIPCRIVVRGCAD